MKQRIRYWSCSRLADWIRGTAKPHSETAGGWRDWKEDAKAPEPSALLACRGVSW
jgi:hypothetical protein